MNLSFKFKLLFFCCLTVTVKGYSQVEFTGVAGPAFHYASVNHNPDSVGTAPVRPGLDPGFAVALEANVPMQHGFRLKAGIRLLNKNYTFKQEYSLPWTTFTNHWTLEGLALETPVHLCYPIVDRKLQITVGLGMTAVKNWLHAGPTGISGYSSSGNGTTTNSYFGDLVTSSYQPEKNNFSLAGELSAEITPAALQRFSMGVVWHQDFMKKVGRITYENQYGANNANSPIFRSKGSFGIESPGYFMVQLKYTIAGKPKDTEREYNSDFESDGSE